MIAQNAFNAANSSSFDNNEGTSPDKLDRFTSEYIN